VVQEDAKDANELISTLKEKKVEIKSTLGVLLPIVYQIHSYALYYPNLEIEVNITKQALFSFSISKTRDDALYGMFS